MPPKVSSKEADYDPICPHCEKELEEIHWRRIKSFLASEYLFICPKCKKVIGIGMAK